MAVLFLRDREEETLEILRMYQPAEGYYLAFSGGKDSVVLYEMAKRAGVKFDAHYHITTADPPELVRFIMKHYPTVARERGEYTMWTIIPKKLMPPTRRVRYCCQVLKERGGENRTTITGVKATDSRNRRHRLVRTCYKKNNIGINPLLNWCDAEIWAFIKGNNLPYCELYDQGFKRLGCIGCPLASVKDRIMELERWPKYRDAYVRAFDRMLEQRAIKEKNTRLRSAKLWKTGEDVMEWWLSRW
jgi:phosphoadenosine phosphosulfate reductase